MLPLDVFSELIQAQADNHRSQIPATPFCSKYYRLNMPNGINL